MSQFMTPFSPRPVKLHPTPMLAKVAVTAAIVGCCFALAALHAGLSHSSQNLEAMTRQAARLEQEQLALQEKVDKLGTVESYLRIASEELGLVEPDTIIIESE